VTNELTATEAHELAKDEICRDCKMFRSCGAANNFKECEGFRETVATIETEEREKGVAMEIPSQLVESLERYRDQGVPTGGFLEAVLSNDLKEAFGRADPFSRAAMFEIVSWCYNEMPSAAWGSPERVEAWLVKWAEKQRRATAREGESA